MSSRRIHSAWLSLALLMFSSVLVSAEDEPNVEDRIQDGFATTEFPYAQLKQYVPKLVTIMDVIGQGDIERAASLTEAELHRQFKEDDGPFDVNEKQHFLQQMKAFHEKPQRFETVDLVGVQQYSTKAFRLVMVGNGANGPTQFQFFVHEYRGRWRVGRFDWFVDWRTIECPRLKEPVTFALAPPQIAEEEKKATRTE